MRPGPGSPRKETSIRFTHGSRPHRTLSTPTTWNESRRKEPIMFRRTKLLVLMFILLMGAALSAVPAIAGAQGKPAAPANGITQVTLGKDATAVAPGRNLLLNQRTFAPGADSGAH